MGHNKPRRTSGRSRNGASYIIAVIAMILVTTSLSGVVLIWGINAINVSDLSFSSALDSKYDRWDEILIIENVDFIDNTSINIYLRNAGSGILVVDNVYVNSNLSNSIRLTLSEQEGGNVTASDFDFSTQSGETYYLLIVTTRGTKASGDFTRS